MAEISKKQLISAESNTFLINSGFINVTNSMEQSCWKHPGMERLIFALPLDTKVTNRIELWNLLYKLGVETGYKSGVTKNLLNNLK